MIRSNPTLSCRSALDAKLCCKNARDLGFSARLLRSNSYDSNLSLIFQTREAIRLTCRSERELLLLFEVKRDVKFVKLVVSDQRWRVKERIPR